MPLVDAQLAQADRNYRRRSAEVRGVLAGFGWAGVGATLGNLFGDIAVGTVAAGYDRDAYTGFAFGLGLFRLHRAEVQFRKALWARRE